jgi:hypothetical protein
MLAGVRRNSPGIRVAAGATLYPGSKVLRQELLLARTKLTSKETSGYANQ